MLNLAQIAKQQRVRELTTIARFATLAEVETKTAKLVVPFEVGPAQHDFVTDRVTFLLMAVGGIGSGKTHGLMGWVVDKLHTERNTGTVGGIFANTYQQLEQATLPKLWAVFDKLGFVEDIDYVYNKKPPAAWAGFRSKFKKHNGILSIKRWGQVVIRSLDEPEHIRGIELGWAAIDELRGTDRETMDVVLGRVRCPLCSFRCIRAATSPNGYDWIHEMMVEEAQARDTKGQLKIPTKFARRVIHMRTQDNPFLSEDYYEGLKASYDPRQAEQELEGRFIQLNSGAVYHQFDRKVHVNHRIVRRPDRNVVVCFDFNRNPFSVVLCQIIGDWRNKPDDAIVTAFDEVRLEGAGTDQMCSEVIRRIGDIGTNQVEVFGDPSGHQNHTSSLAPDYDIIERSFSAAFKHQFSPCWDRKTVPVLGRVNAVNARLLDARGRVRLYISPRCEHLRRDMERVVWVVGSREIDKRDKLLTHMSDALGYFIFKRFPLRLNHSGVMQM